MDIGWIYIAVIINLISTINHNCKRKELEKRIKPKVMPIVCNCYGNLKWEHDKIGFGKEFEDSFLIPFKTAEYKFDDSFKGKYKDVNYFIDETSATITVRRYNSFHKQTDTSRQNVFKGIIFQLEMNKNFQSHTIIRTKYTDRTSELFGLNKTTLEDPVFDKKFDVFTDDEVEARYLITPSFMERLKSMKIAFNAQSVSVSFYNGTLFIALETNQDLFSIGSLNNPVYDEKQFYTTFEEILSIIKLIDHFKLDQKTGL